MSDWWTYRLSDLLLFSPRTYYRTFELYHQQIWPAQVLAGGAVVALLALLRQPEQWCGRAIAALLATCWLWVAVAFHLQAYATINWAARYFAYLFALQALLLVWFGVVRGRLTFSPSRGSAKRRPIVFAVATACSPLAGLIAGRGWRQVELFGVTPDATAVATLVLVILASSPLARAFLVVPLLWCAIGGATLLALGSPEAFVLLIAGLVGLTFAIRTSLRRSTLPSS